MSIFRRKRELTELLPCPFCGKRPLLRETFGKLVVGCMTKGCIAPDTWLRCQTTNLAELAAIWNRRPPKKEPSA